jgi:hypothetical protein
MSEKSSYWYDSSSIKSTTNEVLYVGKGVTCVDVCHNSRLTTVQEKILDKICELVGITDVTSINIPVCLQSAWGTSDENILNFIQFLLDQHCELKTYTDGLPTTNNPFVTLSYCCCNDETGCNTQVTLTLSDHIQKILNCLCDLKTEVATLQSSFTELNNQINGAGGLVSQLAAVKTNADNWILNKVAIQAATDFPIVLT